MDNRQRITRLYAERQKQIKTALLLLAIPVAALLFLMLVHAMAWALCKWICFLGGEPF